MSVYDVNGNELTQAYDVNGASLASVYDVNGNEIPLNGIPDIPVTPLTWNMSDDYKGQVLNALDTIKAYKQEHSGAFALAQFNDVHTIFSGNEPNFIDYNKGYKVLSYMLFLGDMVNQSNATQYANSVAYMQGAQASKRIVGMGNHEYYYYNSSYGNPEALYKAVINVTPTYMDDDYLIYYYDDTAHNVRYIILNYFYIRQSGADADHYLDSTQLEWLASTLESAGSKDIIIAAHSMLNPFTVLRTEIERSSSATIDDQQDLIDVINAFINRSTYGTHNFSGCTGDFIMYTSGHYHILGHSDDFGFNMFTCPARKGTGSGLEAGFVFYIIDQALKKITVIECASDAQYGTYDFTY